MFRKILLPVDGRETTMLVARQGMRMAREVEADVLLLTVLEEAHRYPFPVGFAEGADVYAQLVPDTREALERLYEAGRRQGLRVKTALRTGDPAEQIVAAAVEEGADVIVMAAHCRGPLASLLLGSVSQAVLAEAPCPVQIYGTRARLGGP